MTELPPHATPVDRIAPGTTIREWEVVRFLGRGSYGVVFEAKRSSWLHEPHRALKVFDPIVSAAARSALLGEFGALTGVRHPHLLAGIDAFDLTEPPFAGCVVFVLELAEEDLSHRVARAGALAPAEVAAIGAQVADGLSALHAEGRIHGDVKPENILRTGDRWALGDFGVSGLLEGSYAVTAGATIDYRPPELARAEEGSRLHRSADLWALGVTLHVAATARHPFPGPDPIMRFAAAVRGDRQPAPDLDPVLARIVDEGCLAPEPRDRVDAPTLADQLRAWPTPPAAPPREESVGTLSLAAHPATSPPAGAGPLTLPPSAGEASEEPAGGPADASVEESVGSLPLAPPGDAGAFPVPPLGAPVAEGGPASWSPSTGALPATPPGGPADAPAPADRRTFDVAGRPDAAVPPQVVGAPPVVGPPAATGPPVASAPLLGAPAFPPAAPSDLSGASTGSVAPPASSPFAPPASGDAFAPPALGRPTADPLAAPAPSSTAPGRPTDAPPAPPASGSGAGRWVGLVVVGVVAFVVTQLVAVAAGEVVDGLGARRVGYVVVSLLALGGLVLGAGPRLGSTRRAAVVAGVVWLVATVGLFLR